MYFTLYTYSFSQQSLTHVCNIQYHSHFPQQAVCCEDHKHCCPHGSTCDLPTLTCQSSTGLVAMVEKVPAFTTSAPDNTEAPTQSPVRTTKAIELQTREEDDEDSNEEEDGEDDDNGEEEGSIQCDSHTTCPRHTTCCLMKSSQKWGCCPLPDVSHCIMFATPNNFHLDILLWSITAPLVFVSFELNEDFVSDGRRN